jgi:cephalosporin hydroxylase
VSGRRITIDHDAATVTVGGKTYGFDTPEAFRAVGDAWLRVGWDQKYVYSFTWLGRPVIQLPDDLLRWQELVSAVRPDVIVETGIAHGGSLVFSATLCRALGRGRVIGVDVDIRAHNRAAIEAHPLFDLITLVEGDSAAPETVARVRSLVREGETALVLLDSGHTRDHVLAELRAYADLVPVGSYVVVADAIMERLNGAPRTGADWEWNHPGRAVDAFLAEDSRFVREDPPFPFNEGVVTQRVTYWPGGHLRRVR